MVEVRQKGRAKGLRDCAFVIIAACVFLCVIGNVSFGSILHVYEPVKSSDLEGRSYQTFPKVSVSNISSGTFQDKLETFTADRVPTRNNVILANAAIQRNLIFAANAPFGFEVLPAFFGSKRVFVPELEAVYCFPQKRGDFKLSIYLDQLKTSLTNMVSSGRDDTQWRIALPDSSELSIANPAHNLVSDPFDYLELKQEIETILPEKLQFVDVHYEDADEYVTAFFRTDHHWQIQGGAECYKAVVQSLGREPIDLPEPFLAYNGPFFGSNARTGIIVDYGDVIYDIDHRHSDLTIEAKEKVRDMSYIDKQYLPEGEEFEQVSRYDSLHAAWFHGQIPLLSFTNNDLDETAGSIVIIADSYSNNNGRFYAENFKHVYEIDPRFFEGSINEFIDEKQPDAVLILLCQDSLRTENIRKGLK